MTIPGPPDFSFAAPSRQPAAEQGADAVAAMLRLARGMVAAGRRVNLDGMDQMVGRLCARCLDLPPEEGRVLRPRLAELLCEIDALHTVLAGQGEDPSSAPP